MSLKGKLTDMNLLITGAYKWTNEQIGILRKYGFQVRYIEREDSEIPFDVSDIDAVVCNWLFVHHDIKTFSNLKYIQLLSAGHDRVSQDYIREHQITLRDAGGVYSIPIAEYIVCGVLQLYKYSGFFNEQQKMHQWVKNRNMMELSGKKICIVGVGGIGKETAKRFFGFTDEIYGIDLYPSENPFFKKIYPLSMLDEELMTSDIVILTLPLTSETENMFDRHRFKSLKKGAVFVNAARGKLVDEEALSEALDQNLFGAVCDVFREEPLPQESKLWKKKNLIITPHNSFVSEKNQERMWSVILDRLIEYAEQSF